MIRFLLALLIFASVFFPQTNPSSAQENTEDEAAVSEMTEAEEAGEFQLFKTMYASLYYLHEEDLEAFLWRITGDEEIDIYSYPVVAKSRVDRIIEKIQSVLDMYPERFHIKVYIHRRYDRGPIAFYSHKTHSITTYADAITEKIFAHEAAHAIIRAYFKILPPKKIREMLSQYVDQHLWKD
jgi:hypothetical protein